MSEKERGRRTGASGGETKRKIKLEKLKVIRYRQRDEHSKVTSTDRVETRGKRPDHTNNKNKNNKNKSESYQTTKQTKKQQIK